MIRALRVAALAALFALTSPFASLGRAQVLIQSTSISTAGADCATATNCASFDVTGVLSFSVSLNVATSGTFNWEWSPDATSATTGTWYSVIDDVNAAATATADGGYFFTNPGWRRFRIRASAINGAATVFGFRGFGGLRSTASVSGAGDASAANQATMITRLGTNGDAASATGSNAAQLRQLAVLLNGGLPAALAAGGGLKIEGVAGGVTVPVTATDLDVQIGGSDSLTIGTFPDNEPINVAQINGVTPLMGAGNTGTGSPRVTIATDQAALAAWGLGATGSAVPAGAQYVAINVGGTQRGLTGIAAGSHFAAAMAVVDPSGNHVAPADVGVGAATATTSRMVGAQQTIFKSIDLDETEEEIKATAGELCSLWVTNTATATRWIKFYNATAATVVVGTTTPVITIGVPGNSTDDIAGSFSTANGCLAFSTALTAAATTGVADNDTGAPGANDVIIMAGFR